MCKPCIGSTCPTNQSMMRCGALPVSSSEAILARRCAVPMQSIGVYDLPAGFAGGPLLSGHLAKVIGDRLVTPWRGMSHQRQQAARRTLLLVAAAPPERSGKTSLGVRKRKRRVWHRANLRWLPLRNVVDVLPLVRVFPEDFVRNGQDI